VRHAVGAVLVLAACGRVGFDPRGGIPVSSRCPNGFGPWATPTPIAELNAGGMARTPSVTEDDLVLYFTSDRATGTDDVYRADRASTADPWGNITDLSFGSSTVFASNPMITAGGAHLYFTTVIAQQQTMFTTFDGATYSMPIARADLGNNFAPWVSDDELDAWFQGNLHFARPSTAVGFTTAAGAPELGVDCKAFTFSQDRLELYFSTSRRGNQEIFTTTRSALDQPFATPAPVDVIESAQIAVGDPDLSFDGLTLRYNLNRSLMQTTRECL
jgi:hypothetical protein